MLKKSTNYINVISIALLVYMAFIPNKPLGTTRDSIIDGNFYLENAYQHVKKISKAPHYVGSQNHQTVKSYIIKQLQKMGLTVKTQKTTVSNQSRSFTQVENIFATIKGSNKDGKSLVLMSHYDSEPYHARGAADAGAGVAVVLEGIRAYLRQNIQPKNDIIILITDAEEIGLLGAKAFVNKNALSNNVGAVLNFEARGSSGSSFLLLETNHGNSAMVDMINQAKLPFPASNSLAYSIYKMLPNDTDLTVFREDKDILGFNFAFIDDHFNYHTTLDNVENLSLDSLAHHAHQLMPLLKTLSQIDLNSLKADTDDVYLQIPFSTTISYPFDWTMIISIINLLLFIVVVTIGLKNKSLNSSGIFSASIPLLLSLLATVTLSYILLLVINLTHPHYAEIPQGFTYNGHIYVYLFSLLAFALCFFFYRRIAETNHASNIMVIPNALWILISFAASQALPGAHFFVIVSLLTTLSLTINVIKKKPQPTLTLLLLAPAILIFTPVFSQLPVALGLKVLPYSGLLIVMFVSCFIVSLQIPRQYHINQWLFVAVILGLYIYAESQSSTSAQRPLPTSLYYYQSTDDKDNGYFFTYDDHINEWNKSILSEDLLSTEQLEQFRKEHRRWARFVKKVPNTNIPLADIEIIKQRQYSDKKVFQLKLTTKRAVNRININSNNELKVYKLAINREQIIDDKTAQSITANRSLVRIFTAGLVQFIIDIETPLDQELDLDLIEISPDLMKSSSFNIPKRTTEFIPKPFYDTDSIITKQHITL